MRFLLLFLFISPVYAQFDPGTGADGPCDELMIAAGGTFNCSSLDVDVTPVFIPPVPALIIKVTGDVNITAPIILDGGNGVNINTTNTPGGAGGPGAGDGGGFDAGGTASPGSDFPSISAGNAASSSAVCGGGGAGAGFDLDGDDGNICSGGSAGGLKGLEVDPLEFSFGGVFRGGFGGGSGAEGAGFPAEVGSGGGGGGALHIMAAGTITITANISAKGGMGGSSSRDGGGGGGGSGGVIWIESTKQIINSGAMNSDGGAGGLGTGGTPGPAQPNGDGGAGSRGFIRIEDPDGVVGGSFPGYENLMSNGPAVSSTSSLKSSISCGLVKPNDDQNVFQLAFGFALVAMMAALLKTLSQFRQRL